MLYILQCCCWQLFMVFKLICGYGLKLVSCYSCGAQTAASCPFVVIRLCCLLSIEWLYEYRWGSEYSRVLTYECTSCNYCRNQAPERGLLGGALRIAQSWRVQLRIRNYIIMFASQRMWRATICRGLCLVRSILAHLGPRRKCKVHFKHFGQANVAAPSQKPPWQCRVECLPLIYSLARPSC